MNNFLLALQFLTIIPLKIRDVDEKKLANSLIYFPLVGLLLGLILVGINNLLFLLGFQNFTLNIILVVSLIVLTGGLHLDGLADTFDALLSGKNKEKMLEIMRDSHIGTMGVLALISVILLKISLLSSIDIPQKETALILMCVLSRWSMLLSMFLFPYARNEGKAKDFIEGINFKIFSLSTMIVLVFTILAWQPKGLLLFAVIAISVYLIGKIISNKIKGITGDTLGAINELIEVVTLFSICILQRINL